MPELYKRHIIFKRWSFQHEVRDGIIQNLLPVNWMDLEPNIIT